VTARLDTAETRFSTRTGPRTAAMLGYSVLLLLWSWVVGIPNDPVGVVLWVWLGTIAWDIEAPREKHLDFWRDWWRPVLILVAYWLLRGLADNVGTPVHYLMPIRFDEWLGGGVTPTERLQEAWCADPCLTTTEPRWYDAVFTTVYASHFVTGLAVAGVLWVRSRAAWLLWIRRLVALNVVGLAIYWLYPMAPPWMASQEGLIGEVARVSRRGWSEIDLHRQTMVLFGMANKVAAMPSLHAGVAFLLAFHAIERWRTPLKWLVLLYPLAMTLVLVYSAEHYVVDALVAAVLAAAVIAGCRFWESRRPDATPS
jgi:hypothetical protein